MKRPCLLGLSGLLLAVSVTACTNNSVAPQELPASQNDFFVLANKDGQRWDKRGTSIYSKDKGEFSVFSPDTIPAARTEQLTLRFFLPKGQPLSSARPSSAKWMEFVGADVVTNEYATADSMNLPTIKITLLDTVQKVVEGRFEATLYRDKHLTQQVEKMQFTEGSFRVHYQEVP